MGKHEVIGKAAPELSLPNYDGSIFTFKPGGRPVVIFFYPSAGSFGCTKEACHFRDALSEEEIFKSSQVQVIGISPDPVEKQKSFVEKHKLTYPILSDEKGEAQKAYGVSKGLFGFAPSARVTFIIDSEGIVKDSYDSTIHFAKHHEFVRDWLKKNQPKEPSAAESTPVPAPASTEPSADKPAEGQQSTTA